jgi:hypothetical protein
LGPPIAATIAITVITMSTSIMVKPRRFVSSISAPPLDLDELAALPA